MNPVEVVHALIPELARTSSKSAAPKSARTSDSVTAACDVRAPHATSSILSFIVSGKCVKTGVARK